MPGKLAVSWEQLQDTQSQMAHMKSLLLAAFMLIMLLRETLKYSKPNGSHIEYSCLCLHVITLIVIASQLISIKSKRCLLEQRIRVFIDKG